MRYNLNRVNCFIPYRVYVYIIEFFIQMEVDMYK